MRWEGTSPHSLTAPCVSRGTNDRRRVRATTATRNPAYETARDRPRSSLFGVTDANARRQRRGRGRRNVVAVADVELDQAWQGGERLAPASVMPAQPCTSTFSSDAIVASIARLSSVIFESAA